MLRLCTNFGEKFRRKFCFSFLGFRRRFQGFLQGCDTRPGDKIDAQRPPKLKRNIPINSNMPSALSHNSKQIYVFFPVNYDYKGVKCELETEFGDPNSHNKLRKITVCENAWEYMIILEFAHELCDLCLYNLNESLDYDATRIVATRSGDGHGSFNVISCQPPRRD